MYMAKKYVKTFILTVFVFAFIILISQFFRDLDFYLNHNVDFWTMFRHLLTNIPWFTIKVLPVMTLLALLFSLGDLSKNNEITATKAAGINLWKIIALFLIIGAFIGIADLAAREYVVPYSSQEHEKIEAKRIKKEAITAKTEFSNIIISLRNNARLSVGYLNTKTKIMRDVTIEKYNDQFYIETLILAQSAWWSPKDHIWVLSNGVLRDFTKDMWNERYFKEFNSDIDVSPDDLTIRRMKPQLMNTRELKQYIDRLRIFGESALEERIALNMRYSSIFTHLIVMMIGIPFALMISNKVGKIFSFSLALGVVFIFWGLQAVFQSVGENQLLSPALSAWMPNIIFTFIGAGLLYNLKK